MIKTLISDGGGSTNAASVTKDAELLVIAAPYPPLSQQKTRPFRQFFTTNGLPDGDNSLVVDGSSTNVDFFIDASDTEDRYVTSLSFIVGYGATGKPFQWADGSALTNGFPIFYRSQESIVDLHEGVRSNQDMLRISFSPIPADWEVRHVNANNDFGYFISVDITLLGLPFGIKLDRGSSQSVIIRIRDDMTTDTDSFNCIAYGFNRFE